MLYLSNVSQTNHMRVWNVGSAARGPWTRVVLDIVCARAPRTFKKKYHSTTTFTNILKTGTVCILLIFYMRNIGFQELYGILKIMAVWGFLPKSVSLIFTLLQFGSIG